MIKVTIMRPGNDPDNEFFVRAPGKIDQFSPKGQGRGYTAETTNRRIAREARDPNLAIAMDLIENDSISPHVISDTFGDFVFPPTMEDGLGAGARQVKLLIEFAMSRPEPTE